MCISYLTLCIHYSSSVPYPQQTRTTLGNLRVHQIFHTTASMYFNYVGGNRSVYPSQHKENGLYLVCVVSWLILRTYQYWFLYLVWIQFTFKRRKSALEYMLSEGNVPFCS